MVEKSQAFLLFSQLQALWSSQRHSHIHTLTSAEGSSLGKPHQNLKLASSNQRTLWFVQWGLWTGEGGFHGLLGLVHPTGHQWPLLPLFILTLCSAPPFPPHLLCLLPNCWHIPELAPAAGARPSARQILLKHPESGTFPCSRWLSSPPSWQGGHGQVAFAFGHLGAGPWWSWDQCRWVWWCWWYLSGSHSLLCVIQRYLRWICPKKAWLNLFSWCIF